MGYRLSKIYTKTGDAGQTDAGDGTRVDKCSLQINCLGDIDELNCALGVLMSVCRVEKISVLLQSIQQQLFELGADLCRPEHLHLTAQDVAFIERTIDELNQDLPPLKEFILPGGHVDVAHCHMARAMCRRAERSLVALHQQQSVKSLLMCYVNRLSDLLFVIARTLGAAQKVGETPWSNRCRQD